MNDALHSSNRHDWATPREFFAELHREFRFTIDACANAENTCLPRYWSEQDDALTRSWAGERVFMNPPFGQEIPKFVHKAFDESRKGAEIVVCLLPARVGTAWWHKYVMKSAQIRFIRGRLQFGGECKSGHNAPFDCAVVVFDKAVSVPELSSMARFKSPAPMFAEIPA